MSCLSTGKRFAARLAMASVAAGAPIATQAWAQTGAPATPYAPLEQAQRAQEDKLQREEELKAIENEMRARAEARAKLDEEIASLQADRSRLNAALIETNQRATAAETRVSQIEQRLSVLNASEQAIRRSLAGRRDVIVEVLAALQRMGRRPPPAVLVHPDDMLEAVRSSILLGAVVPELKAETEALASDLAELVRLRETIAHDREALKTDLATLAGERARLSGLVTARQQQLGDVEKTAGNEASRVAVLSSQAQNLKDLIDRMESEIASAQRAAEAARRAAAAQTGQENLAGTAFRDPARLSPKIAFAEARGLLPLPVSGSRLRDFGASDGFGGTTKGISLATRPAATVASPADGWVAFAGPFRSFGQLLIINAGGGYYILLAGMERINVALGQFVLAGEPVAVMGETASPLSTAFVGGSNGPVLYVEFRKDGGSIDPSPWWAKSQGEKVRG
ncbi:MULTISPECIES: peptidoglycan DD-metalloendopeptidase family protein [unclassified Chelatococcus]|uniref:murein hydrolase activator EnvC family protein n=1 Tax=unclassified Chelatococcus TaxID=2638111 RepID=UPI001BCC05BF|nr:MULTISPECIES: peptidoglycan DD-metalloendopeptidase family protein [unclassified Chelatococcus]CAH1653390.1 Septal ring factor EnvC (AmiA/AmiB activator) [Hyphomicrobiales bacterium]MBS7740112.1 peptidoglycan DD-metalloendopeptidase family protein [Chelatococcus sp. HY11]MBX3545059.1 peptidoglycan DD-metalloendopeptidase family protein [Chelatococcus sp.]MCO5078588.1 peptidoglycan DD-metalloendopeptidase family protein [Chelatococcus sp.]CAH1685716.1 Septal ring factor EnvC (AmiA/AmiB activ